MPSLVEPVGDERAPLGLYSTLHRSLPPEAVLVMDDKLGTVAEKLGAPVSNRQVVVIIRVSRLHP